MAALVLIISLLISIISFFSIYGDNSYLEV